jgi:hypothetical protein
MIWEKAKDIASVAMLANSDNFACVGCVNNF